MNTHEAHDLLSALPRLRQEARGIENHALLSALNDLETAIRQWTDNEEVDDHRKFPLDLQLVLERIHELGEPPPVLKPLYLDGGPWE